MTTAQETARAHICLLAEECAHPRFGRTVPGLGTVVLTINAGYE